ncbi:TspO/MBR family protein [Streptomyces sp. NPDC004667]|uniref:TspO/MBR family protein n=1 Tax=Streptomyces sp. NPDC004667 TaxID=3154285 RepID=UPI0033B33EFD
MRPIGEHRAGAAERERWLRYAAAAAAVATTAVAGSLPVDPAGSWYRSLRKPVWQPPSWLFGVVWPPLYASLALAGGHAFGRARGTERKGLAVAFGANLLLNAAWPWLFFACRSPRAGVAGTLLLDAGNAELIRRIARVDAVAARTLLPYAAWCAFATALNTSIARRNTTRA